MSHSKNLRSAIAAKTNDAEQFNAADTQPASVVLELAQSTASEKLTGLRGEGTEVRGLVVTTTADVVNADGETSLREAIALINDGTFAEGSTITFASGVGDAFESGGTILLDLGELVLARGMTIDGDIDGDGDADVTISGQNRSRVMSMDDGDAAIFRDVSLNGLVIRDGFAEREIFEREIGGVIETIYRSRGGGVLSAEALSVSGSEILGNGGESATFFYGAGVYHSGGALEIRDTRIVDNRAIANYDALGGGVFSSSSTTLIDIEVADNAAAAHQGVGHGGGVFVTGDLVLLRGRLSGNGATVGDGSGALGGALYVAGDARVEATRFSDNNVFGSSALGGAIHVQSGAVTILHSQFDSNVASYGPKGGAVSNLGDLSIIGSEFENNSAVSISGGVGGAVFNRGTLLVEASLMTANRAGLAGGAIYSAGARGYGAPDIASETGIMNSTISGNYAVRGAGLTSGFADTLSASNATIVRNSADQGGGVFTDGGSISLTSSLVAQNTGGDLYASANGVFLSGGSNLIGDGSGGGALVDGVNGDIVGTGAAPVDPVIGDLADNGGPTRTHALLVGSPGLDVGSIQPELVTDQRGEGFPRLQGAAPDIGAFEAEVALVTGEVRVAVARSSDDAERNGAALSLHTKSVVLELGHDRFPDKEVGLRFTGLDTPEETEIVDAYLVFTASKSDAGISDLDILMEDSRTAISFGSGGAIIAARDWLDDAIDWKPTATTQGATFRTPNLKPLLDDLLGGDDINASDAFAVQILGQGQRRAWSFDGPGAAPEMVIVYAEPTPAPLDEDLFGLA